METVNNIASAASRAIWGDPTKTTGSETAGTEPVSGKMGNVGAGEPYDRGNDLTDSTSGTKSSELTSGTSGMDVSSATNTRGGLNTGNGLTSGTSAKDSTSATNALGSTTSGTSATDSTSTTLPTYLNYQNPYDKSVDNTTTATPATKDTSNTTSKLTDNIPTTSFDKPATATDNTSSAPSGAIDPSTGIKSQSIPSTFNSTPTTNNNTSNTTSSTTGNRAQTTTNNTDNKASDLSNPSIHELRKEGDHAPKYDTFTSAGGPHIDNPKSDGRVGPAVEKGDLKDFENNNGSDKMDSGDGGLKGSSRKVESKDHAQASATSSKEGLGKHSSEGHGSEHAGEGKEKVSLKEKIKAKLHKN